MYITHIHIHMFDANADWRDGAAGAPPPSVWEVGGGSQEGLRSRGARASTANVKQPAGCASRGAKLPDPIRAARVANVGTPCASAARVAELAPASKAAWVDRIAPCTIKQNVGPHLGRDQNSLSSAACITASSMSALP